MSAPLNSPLQIRLTAGERRAWRRAARLRGTTTAELVRRVFREYLTADAGAMVSASAAPPSDQESSET